MKPFLKWAGSKTRLVAHLKEALPAGSRLVEPFVGSGAVFLNLDYSGYLLGDANKDLISLYTVLQSRGNAFIAGCRELFQGTGSAEEFYALRAEFNSATDVERRASLFVYLNRHCFNGLCRYNASGNFNVPFGRRTNPYFPQEELRGFIRQAERAEFVQQSFVETMKQARPGDVVYCDPPYAPLSSTASFTSYSTDGFSDTEQKLLVQEARRLRGEGVTVVISNHDTPFTRTLYADASEVRKLEVRRTISGKGSSRFLAPELLAIYGNPRRAQSASPKELILELPLFV